MFGENCTKKCDCDNNGSCDPVTGKCTCGPGHFGDKCENTCDQGYHGMGCINHCACVGPNVEGCDPETGRCICKPGLRGNHFISFLPLNNNMNIKSLVVFWISSIFLI